MKNFLIADFTENKYAREPVTALMPDGSMVCAFVTGGPTEPHNENVIMLSHSYDEGRTWTTPELLFSHNCRGVWCTEIFTGGEMPMMIVHTYDGTCPYKELQTFVSYTYDNGKTWQEPISMPAHSNGLCIRKGIILSNGETLFPVYFSQLKSGFGDFGTFGAPDFEDGVRFACGVLISSDSGKSYTPYGCFTSENHLWEPNCVELEDGHIIMYMRDTQTPYINAAESFDYGRTWTHIGTIDIPNADTKLSMEKINGKVVLVSNVCASLEFKGRCELQIQISEDGCKTWKKAAEVAPPADTWFYPHTLVDNNKQLLYVAYENAKQHYINIYTFEELGL